MIQPRQKLKEGDFCKNLTEDQARELMQIDHTGFPEGYEKLIVENGVVFIEHCNGIFSIENPDDLGAKHTFPDFRKLCENTFGDGKG